MKTPLLLAALAGASLLAVAAFACSTQAPERASGAAQPAGTILAEATAFPWDGDGRLLAEVTALSLGDGSILLSASVAEVTEAGMSELTTSFETRAVNTADAWRLPLDGHMAVMASVEGGSWSELGPEGSKLTVTVK